MRLDDGAFQGYLHPARTDLHHALRHGVVVVDTNVLVSLYAQPQRPREAALRWLRSLGDRLWVPHQVAVEFWRARNAALNELRSTSRAMAPISEQIETILRRASLGGRHDASGESTRTQIAQHAHEIERLLGEASGASIDATAALRDTARDPVLSELIDIFGDRVGDRPDDYDALVKTGRARFDLLVPPGYKDAGTKKDQLPERGTGDYLVWEETLRHVASLDGTEDFTVVSNDGKEDWRLVVGGTDIGPRPELVAEALQRTGRRVHIIRPTTFYELTAEGGSEEDQEAAAELAGATAEDWTQESFDALIQGLYDGGYEAQADVILAAALTDDGFISRDDVYKVAGFDPDRTLTRFAVPASRIAGYLREDETLAPEAPEPLRAVYNGPGKALGYRVPLTFSEFAPAWDDEPEESAATSEESA